MSEIYADQAIRFVETLQRDCGEEWANPSTVKTLKAGLTSMLQTANVIESAMKDASKSFRISFSLSARIERFAQYGAAFLKEDEKIVSLWDEEKPRDSAREETASADIEEVREKKLSAVERTASEESSTSSGQEQQPFQRIRKRRRTGNGEVTKSSIPNGDTPFKANDSPKSGKNTFTRVNDKVTKGKDRSRKSNDSATRANENSITLGKEKDVDSAKIAYTVPEVVAAQCLSLLLDSGGVSTHLDSGVSLSFKSVKRKLLNPILRELYEEATNADNNGCLEQDDNAEGDSNEADTYRKLIPSFLRSDDAHVSLPMVTLGRSSTGENFVVTEWKVIHFQFRRPDRNSKEVNIILLCVQLHFYGLDGVLGTVLTRRANLGFGQVGCETRRNYSRSVVASCRKGNRCTSEPNPSATFFKKVGGERRAVGKGTIIPRLVYLQGGPVPTSFIAVRFHSIEAIAEIEELVKGNLHKPILWERGDIERVTLMDGEGTKIGTAIVADENPLQDGWGETLVSMSVLDRDGQSGRIGEGVSVRRAVAVADVRLAKDVGKDGKYHFREWYEKMKRLREAHFTDGVVARTLGDLERGTTAEALWFKDWIRRADQS